MYVKDLTVEQLQTLIRETVLETLEDYFNDPDIGLNLRENVKQQLLASKKQADKGETGMSLEEVIRELGLDL